MRRLLLAIAPWLFLSWCVLAQSVVPGFPPGVFVGRGALDAAGGGGGRTCTDGTNSANFLARTSGLSNGQKDNYCVLINGLDTDGVFALGDQLLVYAAPDSTTALLNLLSSTLAPTASISGSPSFTANTGFAGGGTAKINTGLNASTSGGQFGTVNASAFVFSVNSWTSGQASGAIVGYDSSSSDAVGMYPHFSDNNFYIGTQVAGLGTAQAYIAATHFYGFLKHSAGPVVKVYQNTTSGNANSNGSSPLINDNFIVLGDNAAGFRPYAGTVSASWFGGSFGDASAQVAVQAALYNRLCTFLTTVRGSC